MKRIPLFLGMIVGSVAGLLSSVPDGLGLQVVMALIGLVTGAAVGGALSGLGRLSQRKRIRSVDDVMSVNLSLEGRLSSYWFDKGRLSTKPGISESDVPDRDTN